MGLEQRKPVLKSHAGMTVLIHADSAVVAAKHFFLVTLDGGSLFALALGCRFLIKFATANLGKYTCFFTGTFEAA